MRDTQRERQRHRQREKQALCREPDVGLDPGTPGSHPEPKADTQPLNHPGVPKRFIYLRERKRAQAGVRGTGRGKSRFLTEQGAPCGVRSQDPRVMS